MSKRKFTYFILLIFCIEILPMEGDNKNEQDDSLKSYLLFAGLAVVAGVYKFALSDEHKKWLGDNSNTIATFSIPFLSSFCQKYLNSDSEREKLTKRMLKQNIQSTKYDNELKKQKIVLQNDPDYQKQQIESMAAENALKAGPEFIALQMRQAILAIEQAELAHKKEKAEFRDEEKRAVEEARIKIKENREALEDDSLAQEERSEIEREQAYLKKFYQEKTS